MMHPRGEWLNPDTGRVLDRQAFMKEMAAKQVVLLGETHNIAEIHRWQMHVAVYLHACRADMMMGFEMFPRSKQAVLDKWVEGKLRTDEFLEEVEWAKVWGFPPEIYLPLFHFCRQNKVRMLALNCYRELVTRVGQEGWDAVPEEERDGLTPYGPEKPGHGECLQRMFGGPAQAGGPMSGDRDRFLRAQRTWDRAFACNIHYAIEEAREDGRDPLVIGIIGMGHMLYGYGTPYELDCLGIKCSAVLLPVSDKNFEEPKGIADGLFKLDIVEDPVSMEKRRPQE